MTEDSIGAVQTPPISRKTHLFIVKMIWTMRLHNTLETRKRTNEKYINFNPQTYLIVIVYR